MIVVRGYRFPAGLQYDVPNHCWYRQEPDGTVSLGMTEVAVALAGEVLACTPKRVGLSFEASRSCAVIESGKWVGPVRAAFAGEVAAVNDALILRPSLINADPYGDGWIVRARVLDPAGLARLVGGNALKAAYQAWMEENAFPPRVD